MKTCKVRPFSYAFRTNIYHSNKSHHYIRIAYDWDDRSIAIDTTRISPIKVSNFPETFFFLRAVPLTCPGSQPVELRIVQQPPGQAVYQRILRPFPTVSIYGVILNNMQVFLSKLVYSRKAVLMMVSLFIPWALPLILNRE